MPSDPRLSCVKQAEILHKDFDSYCSPQSLLRGLWFVYNIIIACPYPWVSLEGGYWQYCDVPVFISLPASLP